jgi:hypothetical protein
MLAMRKNRASIVLVYVALGASILLLPHYTSKGYALSESGDVVLAVISVALRPYRWLAPIFHVMTPLLILSISILGNRARRFVAAYFAVDYAIIAGAQGIADTERFGFTVVTGTVASIALIALLWVGEALRPQNETVFRRIRLWRYWVVPLALLAFWAPSPKLEPIRLLTSDYGIAFCVTTPVVLALLTILYPRINITLLRAMGTVGFVIGLLNMYSWFNPGEPNVWLGILHIPLVLTSAFALVLPFLPSKWLTDVTSSPVLAGSLS